MRNKIIFGLATFFMGLFSIGFIISMIGALFDNFSLMDFGMNMLLTAYGVIISSILLFIVCKMFDYFRSI